MSDAITDQEITALRVLVKGATFPKGTAEIIAALIARIDEAEKDLDEHFSQGESR